MSKHLVLAGGGHAHMLTLANLHRFIKADHKVTVIGPSEYHYYSGMGPGMLGETYSPEEIRFATRYVVEKQGGTFLLDKIIKVNPEAKEICLESGKTVTYDVISFNTGSYVAGGENKYGGDTDIYTVKPIEKLYEARQKLIKLFDQKKIDIGVVGGGPSAVEISGNIWRLASIHGRYKPEIKIFAGHKLMNRFPNQIRKSAKKSLKKRGIEIIENGYVLKTEPGMVTIESGQRFKLDFIFAATGVKPSKIFSESDLPTSLDGGLIVNEFLQSTRYPEIFGGGDCIHFKPQPLDKVGVYAVRENPVLFHNLTVSLDGGELIPFDPGGEYLLIFNLGDNTGILKKKWFMHSGRIAFMIKDYIDRKFMKKFQALEK